jgi:AcrR family transcriptional regulator
MGTVDNTIRAPPPHTKGKQLVRPARRSTHRRRGRPPSSGGPSTEERLLDTARELFSELGYEKCTFSEIAERAGLTRPAINHYFRGKKELYDAVFQSTERSVIASGVANASLPATLTERLTAFLNAASQADSTDRTYTRFISSSLLDGFRHPELQDRAQSQLNAVREFIADSLRTAIKSGEVSEDIDVSAVTEMLLAVLWGMGLYAGFIGNQDQLKSVIEQFSRLLTGTLWWAPG